MPSLLAAFTRSHADVEVTAVESYGGMLLRDLRDGRRDAVVAPSRDRFPNAHVLRALCRTRIGDPFLTINARGAAACCRLCEKRCKHAVRASRSMSPLSRVAVRCFLGASMSRPPTTPAEGAAQSPTPAPRRPAQ
jgi:hypothetical protein